MADIFIGLDPIYIALALSITLLAGFVKGAVGFALPMIMISGLGSFLPPEIALAALILPTVVTNLWQALRNGMGAAVQSIRRFWLFITIVLVFILGSAQMVRILPSWALFLILGVPVCGFAMLQLAGWRLHLRPERQKRAEVVLGGVAGFVGGMSGVWGPPTVTLLTALGTPKQEHVRVQGVVYGAGAVMLFAAHLKSGVLNATTLPLSLAMTVPALIGLALGFLVHDRLEQHIFRKATLIVLVIAGLNLVRRGLMG
jgi:hypothetical protein